MNVFDITVVSAVNQYAQRSWAFDNAIYFLSNNHLLKGGVLTTLIWWLWFRDDPRQGERRAHILATFAACVVSMAVARTVALTAPFRLRPLHEPALAFRLPFGEPAANLDGWSSFPSDHAALFFTLATGLLFASRRAGLFALLYTTVFICLPRLYLGLHYPTDLIAGAALGALSAVGANRLLAPRPTMLRAAQWSLAAPASFYPLVFLFTFQVAEMFDSTRAVLSAANAFMRAMTGHS
jgi:undecaprenyl-diphosphatase